MKLSLIVVVLVLLAACASDPVPVNYYLLAPPQEMRATVRGADLPAVVIDTVELAAYLRQGGLVMQSGDNQLLVSSTHLWAENLEQAFPRALLQQLQQQTDAYAFYLRLSDFISRTDYSLHLHIDSLQPSDAGEVVLSGRYQLVAASDDENPLDVRFFFQRDLTMDGYPHAVEQMQALVGELAASITMSLRAMPAAG